MEIVNRRRSKDPRQKDRRESRHFEKENASQTTKGNHRKVIAFLNG